MGPRRSECHSGAAKSRHVDAKRDREFFQKAFRSGTGTWGEPGNLFAPPIV